MNASARDDLILGMGIVLISVFVMFTLIPAGIVLPGNNETRALAPDFWPTIIIWATVFAGICLIGHGWLHRKDLDGTSKQANELGKWGIAIRIVSAFAAMLVCYFLVPTLGMVLCTILLCIFLMWFGGERRPVIILSVSIILPVLLFLFFSGFAGVPIPTGIFEGILESLGS